MKHYQLQYDLQNDLQNLQNDPFYAYNVLTPHSSPEYLLSLSVVSGFSLNYPTNQPITTLYKLSLETSFQVPLSLTICYSSSIFHFPYMRAIILFLSLLWLISVNVILSRFIHIENFITSFCYSYSYVVIHHA